MIVEAQITIRGTKQAVWDAISDIEHATKFMSGIKGIEVLEKPADGLLGLKWRETRVLFGESASVIKWINNVVDLQCYETQAADKGFVFVTTMSLSEQNNVVILKSTHASLPQTLAAKFQILLMRLFFKGIIRKAILQDLTDVKSFVENPCT